MRRPKIDRFPGAHVIGLDLSLRASAACALPLDWDGRMAAVATAKMGYGLKEAATPTERIERIANIAHAIYVFAEQNRAVAVYYEDYAFGVTSKGIRERAELVGVVCDRLYRMMLLAPEPIASARARKILLQKLPRKDVKAYVYANVKRLGKPATGWTDDEADAFTCANAGLMIAGGTALTFPGIAT